ncbi:MAG: hypothetical protein ACTHNW_04115 [Mucilaginibacter sp.]
MVEEIPRSIIKTFSIGSDVDFLNGKDKLLFVSPECVVTGLDNLPNVVFITPQFDFEKLPAAVWMAIYAAKTLIIQPSFYTGRKAIIQHSSIPQWVNNFKELECLQLRCLDIDNLHSFTVLPIEELILGNVNYSDGSRLVNSIIQFPQLKKIVYDDSLCNEVLNGIKGLAINVNNVKD